MKRIAMKRITPKKKLGASAKEVRIVEFRDELTRIRFGALIRDGRDWITVDDNGYAVDVPAHNIIRRH